MHASTGRAQPHRVVHATGLDQNQNISAPWGEPLAKFVSVGLERPNPPTHAYDHRGGAGKWIGAQQEWLRAQKNRVLENRGEPLAKFWSQGSERPNPPTHAYRHRGAEGT